MQELESIICDQPLNIEGLDGSMLFFSGCMMPLTALNTPGTSGPGMNMPGPPSLSNGFDKSLLDYAKSLTTEFGFNSSSINPSLPSSYKSKLDKSLLDAVHDWSQSLSLPSPSLTPKINNIFSIDYNKIAEKMSYGFSAPSTAFRAASTFKHDWNFDNNVLSGLGSPSSSFTPFKQKANLWDKPSFEMPEFKMPEIKTREYNFPSFKPIKPEPYTPPKLPEFKTFKERFDMCKPTFEMPTKCFGLMNPKPFQLGYDLPGTGTQLHLHGPNKNIVTEGRIYDYNRDILKKEINGYDASIAALRAERLGFKKFFNFETLVKK